MSIFTCEWVKTALVVCLRHLVVRVGVGRYGSRLNVSRPMFRGLKVNRGQSPFAE